MVLLRNTAAHRCYDGYNHPPYQGVTVDRKTKGFFGLWAITALVVILINLLTACGGYITPIYAVNPQNILNNNWAITVCAKNVNQPGVFIADSLFGTPWQEVMEVHEGEHVKQALTYPGGCWAMVKRYREPSQTIFRFNIEARAYCVSNMVAFKRGLLAEDGFQARLIEYLRERYTPEATPEDATQRYNATCLTRQVTPVRIGMEAPNDRTHMGAGAFSEDSLPQFPRAIRLQHHPLHHLPNP